MDSPPRSHDGAPAGGWRPLLPAALLAVLTTGACGPAGEPDRGDPRPNVILVSIDTLRADALGAYGGPVPTPVLDRLAAEGVLFEQVWAPAALTAPSHTSLLTGREPLQHGVVRNGAVLPDDLELLSERFAAEGYATGAFVSSFVLDARFGWTQGFDVYDSDFPEQGSTVPKERGNPGMFFLDHEFGGFDRRADAAVDAVLAWLRSVPEPYFLFVHLFDPHDPYDPPEGYAQRVPRKRLDLAGRSAPDARQPARLRRLVQRYHGEVLFTDEQLGRLLEAVDRSERRRIVTVTADHGEGLGQHDWLYHAENLYEEAIRIPWIVHDSAASVRGVRLWTPVGLVDVAPTLLELAGVGGLARADGRSQAASVREGSEPEPRPVFAHRRAHPGRPPASRGEMLAVRDERWKLIRNGTASSELYDLASDPGEQEDRYRSAERAPLAALREQIETHERAREASVDGSVVPDDVRAALEALGYTE